MGANVLSLPRTQRDPVRIFSQARGSAFDSVRRCQTPRTGLVFPGAEEVTGSKSSVARAFFEILSDKKARPGGLVLLAVHRPGAGADQRS